jgi:hypothetical protein
MSYGNEYSNKPFERASKSAHTSIINDPEVRSFLKQCYVPPYSEETSDIDIGNLFFGTIEKNPIRNIITVDGGYSDVIVKDEFPSSTVAFFQFGALFFKHKDLVDLKEKPFVDPDDISKLQNIQRIKLAVPTKGLVIKDEQDLISSVRKTMYDFFMKSPEKKGLAAALKWLLFEEYDVQKNPIWHLASCPHCMDGFDFSKRDVNDNFVLMCPNCKKQVYLTDVLRLHEAIDNELGAGGILGYISTTVEQLIIVFLIKQIIEIRPGLMNETLFIKDGPLAFFGQTANLHEPMKKLITFLNKNYGIYLVGLEKSGPFVEHASRICTKLEMNQTILLGNKYIYKYIIPGHAGRGAPYGQSTYYGHKIIYKSQFGNVYVATVPCLGIKREPDVNDYINVEVILANISALKCDLYYNSLVPVVMANKLVSLADHPSADLLASFAQDSVYKRSPDKGTYMVGRR